ncbi:MAG: hypothetical protein JW720_04025 [Sedimentisphaerales bacterium]|nr:hypothetical protein [Sedimentisphaerales bacterium]
MANERQQLQIFEGLLFPKLFQAFGMAVQPSKLILALLGLTVICLAGYIMDFSATVVVTPETQETVTELQIYLGSTTPDTATAEFRRNFKENGRRTGVFSAMWRFGAQKLHAALWELFQFNLGSIAKNIADYFKAVAWAIKYHYIYCGVFALIKLVVFAVIGGTICRLAALQFARSERPELIAAMRFSLKKFASFFFSPLVPVIGILGMGIFVFALGLLCNIPVVGPLLTSLFTLLALLGGTVIAAILIGLAAGFNLMPPAVAYDGLDALDVMGRSYSYVFRRPWRMVFYTGISGICGAVCYLFVRFFAFLLILVTFGILRLSVWSQNSSGVNRLTAIWSKPEFMNFFGANPAAASSTIEAIAAFIVHLCLWIVAGLVVSVVITFYFSANTIIYALMRNKVDDSALDDVFLDSEEPHLDAISDSDDF